LPDLCDNAYVTTLGCQWNVSACLRATEDAHRPELRWASADGFQWDETTACSMAPRGSRHGTAQLLPKLDTQCALATARRARGVRGRIDPPRQPASLAVWQACASGPASV
jgi:hypothetical protein